MGSMKVAATDTINKIKLCEMIKNVTNSKHEHYLYKEILEPFDQKKYQLIGPYFRSSDKVNIIDYRNRKSPVILRSLVKNPSDKRSYVSNEVIDWISTDTKQGLNMTNHFDEGKLPKLTFINKKKVLDSFNYNSSMDEPGTADLHLPIQKTIKGNAEIWVTRQGFIDGSPTVINKQTFRDAESSGESS